MEDNDPIKKKKEMFGDADEAEEKRGGGWFRRTLIGLLLVAIAALLLWFLVIFPQSNQISQLSVQATEAQDQLATQVAEVASLETVKPEREVANLLADAFAARYEIATNEFAGASAALLSSPSTLATLSEELGEDYTDTITDLRSRLDLVKKDVISKKKDAADNDLEVYINILTQLQRALSAQ